MKVSACLIVRNELKTLPACLRTLIGYVDEIVIVDTGSTDGTQYLIKGWQKSCSNGTQIIYDEYKWHDDFSAARNYAMSKASGDWLFTIDADDRVNVKNWDSINKILKSESDIVSDYDMIACVIYNVYGAASTIESRFIQPRFFRTSSGPVYKGAVHNQISFPNLKRDINAIKSDFEIFHTGYGMLDKETLAAKSKRALRMTKEYVEEKPEDSFGWFNYGNALKSSLVNHVDDETREDSFKEAFAALDNAIKYANVKENHIFINSVTIKGWLHYAKQEYDLADNCAGMALKEKPDHIDAILLRGFCNADADKLEIAEYWLKQYIMEHEKIQTMGKYDYVMSEYMGHKGDVYKTLAAIEFRRRDTIDRVRAVQMM